MANNKLSVTAILLDSQRKELLGRIAPKFENVYALGFTWAYNVPLSVEYPMGELTLIIDEVQTDALRGVQVATGTISDGETMWQRRPDGRRIHITLSTKDGVPPAEAGRLEPGDGTTTPIEPITLTVYLARRTSTKQRPDRNDRIAA